MCGATDAQDQLQQEQIQAYQQAQQLTAEQYQNQQEIYAPMAAQFQSIFSQGPNQKGFSDAEEEDLNAQAIEGTAENYEGAAKAVGESEAAQGGGTNPLPTGAQEQQRQQIAQSSAQTESQEENQIQEADYQQGLSDWQTAGAGLETIASGENPLGYEGAETSSGSAASTTADQIAQENNSWINAAIGAVGTAAGGWATGGFKTPCWIAAELYGGWMDPRTMAIRNWLIGDFSRHALGRWLVRLYSRYGRSLAVEIKQRLWLRRIFQWVFDRVLVQATRTARKAKP